MSGFPYPFGSAIADSTRLAQALRSNFAKAATKDYVNTVGAGLTLAGLADVDTTGAPIGAFLKWDGALWQDATLAIADVSGLQVALDAKQPLDSDLTAVAGLAPANDDVIQRKGGVWSNRTMAQLASDLDAAGLATDSALSTGLAGKANATHTHAQSDVTNLVSDLAAKASSADSRFPTANEKAALVGTSGTATSGANKLVDNADTRLTNARTPTSHASSHGSGGSDPVTLAQSQVTNLVADLSAKADTTYVDTAFTAWRDISMAQGYIAGGTTAAGYLLLAGGGVPVSNLGSLLNVPLIRLVAGDYGSVSGKSLKLRIVGSCTVNATAPVSNFESRLYSVATVAGGAGALTRATGVATISTPTWTTPAASSITLATGTSIAFPADGIYALGITNTATLAANSIVAITLRLQVAWV